MAAVLKQFYKGYFWLFHEIADHRSDGYFLVSSPFEPFFICLFYTYIINIILPAFMKNRKPYKLDAVVKLFNFSQILVNGYMCFHATTPFFTFNWFCAEIDPAVNETTKFYMFMGVLYYYTKLADLLDTVFFFLRGKSTQASFLHCYHHFGMVVVSWAGAKFLCGGHSVYILWVNSLVHTVMYTYYFLTIWDPRLKAKLWWKKYITQLQLLQFVFILVTYGQVLLNKSCRYPKIGPYFIIPQAIVMIVLFGDFYRKTYLKNKK